MAKIKRSFGVLGLSKFGYRTAMGLFRAGATVIAVDTNEHLVEKISQNVTKAVTADAMDFEVLERIGIFDVDVAIIGFRSSFDATVLLTNRIRKDTRVSRIIAQVDTDEKEEVLRLMGADIVVFPERDIADRLVKRLAMDNLVEHIPLSPDVSIIEVPVPEDFIGKSLAELKIRAKHHVYVLGIQRKKPDKEKEDVLISPPADTSFLPGDTMLVLGKIENLRKFTRDNRM